MRRLFNKIASFLGFGLGEIPRFNKLADIPRAATREDRKRARRQHWERRFLENFGYSEVRGGPRLTGARLERVCDQCSPKHLTVLCRGAFKTWAEGQLCQ
jgi:hypothetical protein